MSHLSRLTELDRANYQLQRRKNTETSIRVVNTDQNQRLINGQPKSEEDLAEEAMPIEIQD